MFNLDAMATICQTLSTTTDNLWIFSVDNTKNMLKGIDFIFPYVVDKTSWPFVHDVMYWDEWPVAHPFLIFGALQTGNKEWLSAWSELEHFPETDEVIRNLPDVYKRQVLFVMLPIVFGLVLLEVEFLYMMNTKEFLRLLLGNRD